jgi:putative transposase
MVCYIRPESAALTGGLQITCWNGDLIRLAFIIDAHDREIIAWHAVANAGISGSIAT